MKRTRARFVECAHFIKREIALQSYYQGCTPTKSKPLLTSSRKLLAGLRFEGNIIAMNKIFQNSQLTPYEADYARWCAEQGALLREGRVSDLDRENLAEEIESLGRSDKREIENRLKVLLAHLLKLQFQPKQMKEGWRSTVVEQRRRIRILIKESPSLRSYPLHVLAEEYEYARSDAADETGLPVRAFPETCSYAIEDILDLSFYPEAVDSGGGQSDLA